MQLGKPPIIEVSIEFSFESSSGEPEWDYTRAAEFVDRFQAEYPETEVAAQHLLVEVQKVARGTKPTLESRVVPVAVRAFPANRSQYLLSAKDKLQCFFVRTGENDYRGFSALKAEAMDKLVAYVEYFRPAKLIHFTVQYVDFFRIPLVNGRADLRDYFTICGEPDESIFGMTINFRKSFTTKPPDSEDLLTCELYNVAKKGKEQKAPSIPFRMEWGLHAFKNLSWDAESLSQRLQKAHDGLLHCFANSFTKTGWALFDPTGPHEGRA